MRADPLTHSENFTTKSIIPPVPPDFDLDTVTMACLRNHCPCVGSRLTRGRRRTGRQWRFCGDLTVIYYIHESVLHGCRKMVSKTMVPDKMSQSKLPPKKWPRKKWPPVVGWKTWFREMLITSNSGYLCFLKLNRQVCS